MKLYIGYEFNTNIPTHIMLYSGVCFVADSLKTMQQRIDNYGEKDKDYSVYRVDIKRKLMSEILDNVLCDCAPPGNHIPVLDLYIMTKGRKTAVPYNVWIKENEQN